MAEGFSFSRPDRLPAEEFAGLIQRSGLNRPAGDLDRLSRMIDNSNLIIAVRRNDTQELVGVVRSLTDFAYCCYLSDLCVDRALQGRGIGRALMAETKRITGPHCNLVLLSSPDSMAFYERLGMETISNGFIKKRDAT